MKKILMIAMVSLIILLTTGPALAWRGHSRGHFHGHSHFGLFFGPPVFYLPPPPVYPRYYYPPDYYYPGDRVWIPGYWGLQGDPVWFGKSLDSRTLGMEIGDLPNHIRNGEIKSHLRLISGGFFSYLY